MIAGTAVVENLLVIEAGRNFFSLPDFSPPAFLPDGY
jgi:hypothetical protein